MDNELIFWIICGIASLVGLAAIYVAGKREEERTVTWIRDWGERR